MCLGPFQAGFQLIQSGRSSRGVWDFHTQDHNRLPQSLLNSHSVEWEGCLEILEGQVKPPNSNCQGSARSKTQHSDGPFVLQSPFSVMIHELLNGWGKSPNGTWCLSLCSTGEGLSFSPNNVLHSLSQKNKITSRSKHDLRPDRCNSEK